MNANVGKADRVVRVIIGLVPLLTAAIGYCPLYSIIGMNTCGVKR